MTSLLQFGGFVFPHNPRVLRVDAARRTERFAYALGGESAHDAGAAPRAVHAQGEFYGDTAAADYAALQAMMEQGEAWWLLLPSALGVRGDAIPARLTGLTVTGQAGPAVLAYQAEWTEVRA